MSATEIPQITVGTELPAVQLPKITRTTLALFAGASGDHDPMHIDIDAAKSVGLEDVFAHGMLSMAYLGQLLTDWVPQSAIRSWNVRFAAIPLYANPTCTGAVTAVDGGVATLDIKVSLADGTVTLAGEAVVDAEELQS